MSKYRQHYDEDGDKSGTSEGKKDLWGDDYTQHYDNDSDKSGTSEDKADFWGDDYKQHYDSDGDKSGTSETKTDFWGSEYTQHYDAEGNKSGTSETKTDFWGSEYTQHSDSDGDNSGTSEDKDGCFLSTACVRSQGLPDDCDELTVLRCFRDDHLKRSLHGRRLIEQYYKIAPTLVDSINAQKNQDEIYAEIYTSVVLPCVSLIHQGRFQKAQQHYDQCVSDLVNRFLQKK